MIWRAAGGLTVLAVVCLIPLVGQPQPVKGQSFRGGHSCGHGQRFVFPSYYSPPVVYHQPAVYHAPAVVKKEVLIVPKAVKVLVSPDYYYSISDGYREALLADAIAYRLLAAQGRAAPPSEVVPRYEEPKTKRPGGSAPQAATEVSEALKKLADARCAKCHSGGDNGIDLDDLSTVPEGQRWHAHALVNSGEMPKGGKAITDDEVKLFYEWAKSARKKK
jgi:mono/diheme cytochrome c family protein